MKVTVKLFATLKKDYFESREFDCADGTTVRSLLDSSGIKDREYHITFVNGRHADRNEKLKDGDTLSVFPAVGGG